MQEDMFDNLFFTIIQKSGGLEVFWDQTYSFLRRRTDFFSNKSEAESILTKYCQKHFQIYEQEQKAKKEREAELSSKSKKNEQVKEVEKKVDEEEIKKKLEEQIKKKGLPKEDSKEENEDDKLAEGKVMPVNNGSTTDKYMWTQTLEELQILIPIDAATKSRDCKVNWTPTTLEIILKGESYAKGELFDKIVVDECVWIIDDGPEGRFLHLSLLKWPTSMSWWECILKGDECIDTQKVKPENSNLSDLDGETRGTVEKMMFDMRQKQMGKPSSDDLLKMEKMKPFMDAHPEMDWGNVRMN